MTVQFDDQLLDEFVQTFYGYGRHCGKRWFIGMKEGGGHSFAEVAKRLNAWADRGKCELEDLAEYHRAIGKPHWFTDPPKLQPTWSKLIRILLSSDAQIPTTEQVRKYQRDSWGRLDGDTCLLDLLPPLPDLANREGYEQCRARRIAHLRRQIREFTPKVVVFYSFGYRDDWQAIAEVGLSQDADGIYVGRNDSTLFVMTKHPTTPGVTNDYFHQVGRLIARILGEH